MENDPIEEEFDEVFTELTGEAHNLPAAGMQVLARMQESRLKRLQLVERRLAKELDEDDIRLLQVRHSIQRSATLRELAQTRAQREAVRPIVRPHEWAAYGTVRFQNGNPAAGARVALFDRDRANARDFLGDAVTNRSGDFVIIYHVRDFSDDTGQIAPNLVLRVLNKRGKPIVETEQSIRARAGRVELFDITLPVNKIR